MILGLYEYDGNSERTLGKVPIRLNLLEVNLLKEGCAFLRRIVYCLEIAMKRDLLNAQVMNSTRVYIKEK